MSIAAAHRRSAAAAPAFGRSSSSVARRPVARTTTATKASHNAGAATAAAAAAALLLATGGPLQAAELPSLAPAASPVADVAAAQQPGLLERLLTVGRPKAEPKAAPLREDPFGADRAQRTEVADTKHPIPIITEQEAVAPEAFPNPSQDVSSKPPVLAAAEGDEHLGDNAGQFSGLQPGDRQGLINKKSPAQASASAAAAPAAAPVSLRLLPEEQPASSNPGSNPGPLLAEGGGSLLDKIKSVLPNPPRVDEDPFGADRYQSTTIADTKLPMPIITEQEAVVTEAFPNPSQDFSSKPPVLAAAEGDENLGDNAGQFAGVTEADRQGLIDAKSPAQATGTTGNRN